MSKLMSEKKTFMKIDSILGKGEIVAFKSRMYACIGDPAGKRWHIQMRII